VVQVLVGRGGGIEEGEGEAVIMIPFFEGGGGISIESINVL